MIKQPKEKHTKKGTNNGNKKEIVEINSGNPLTASDDSKGGDKDKELDDTMSESLAEEASNEGKTISDTTRDEEVASTPNCCPKKQQRFQPTPRKQPQHTKRKR
jgi:hypothetical protein